MKLYFRRGVHVGRTRPLRLVSKRSNASLIYWISSPETPPRSKSWARKEEFLTWELPALTIDTVVLFMDRKDAI